MNKLLQNLKLLFELQERLEYSWNTSITEISNKLKSDLISNNEELILLIEEYKGLYFSEFIKNTTYKVLTDREIFIFYLEKIKSLYDDSININKICFFLSSRVMYDIDIAIMFYMLYDSIYYNETFSEYYNAVING